MPGEAGSFECRVRSQRAPRARASSSARRLPCTSFTAGAIACRLSRRHALQSVQQAHVDGGRAAVRRLFAAARSSSDEEQGADSSSCGVSHEQPSRACAHVHVSSDRGRGRGALSKLDARGP
jgi:hypothetical protein